MSGEDSEKYSWVKPVAYVAAAAVAGVGGYVSTRAGDNGKPAFSLDERLTLERRLSGIETRVDRFDQIVAGGRKEMSEAARERIEATESDIAQNERADASLERRVRELEERVSKLERKIP